MISTSVIVNLENTENRISYKKSILGQKVCGDEAKDWMNEVALVKPFR